MQLNVPPDTRRSSISASLVADIRASKTFCAAPWKLKTPRKAGPRSIVRYLSTQRKAFYRLKGRADRRGAKPPRHPSYEGELASRVCV